MFRLTPAAMAAPVGASRRKINFWARLHDGDRAHKLLGEQLRSSTLSNLFDTHPPFQIDGNFGATAGITEMLLQSQGGAFELLPALPAQWSSGDVRGLRTRGRLSINIKWQDRSLIEATMRPSIAGLVKLRASSREFVRTNQRGQVVSLPDAGIECSFMAQSGEHYFLRRGTSQ